MKVFLDTSSLLKLYHEEVDSGKTQEVLSSDVEKIFLSEIAIVEFRSAIWKKVREREIDERGGCRSCFVLSR